MPTKVYVVPRVDLSAAIRHRESLMSEEELATVLSYIHKDAPKSHLPQGGWTVKRIVDIETDPESQPVRVLLDYLHALDAKLVGVLSNRLPRKPKAFRERKRTTHRILKPWEPEPF